MYANPVIDLIDPDGVIFSARLYRHNCIQMSDGVRVKDLRVISNRPMDEMLLIDNSALSFGHQVSNGIPILSFYDDRSDKELFHLTNYLESIHSSKNL